MEKNGRRNQWHFGKEEGGYEEDLGDEERERKIRRRGGCVIDTGEATGKGMDSCIAGGFGLDEL